MGPSLARSATRTHTTTERERERGRGGEAHTRGNTCNEMEPEERGVGLIPGLPEELVLSHVVPRLPWYTRPVCRAISRSWRAWIDTSRKCAALELQTRKYQLPLLQGLFLICTFDAQIFITSDQMPCEERRATYNAVEWRKYTYQIQRQWRKLPPLQHFLPPPPSRASLVASSGMVYVWSKREPTFVMKMDMGCGDWTWNKFPVPHPFNVGVIGFNDKFYVPQVSTGGPANQREEVVLVYDMMTDQCKQVETWNYDTLRVLLKKDAHSSSHGKEELYSLVEHESMADSKLELLVYDASRDSWRSKENIPIPECRWSAPSQLKLLNGDCFEPASEMGVNTVWIDSQSQLISWFNSSLHNSWVDIDYNPFLEGKYLEYIQFIQGSLYGIFCEDDEGAENKGRQEDEEHTGGQQDQRLSKRTIMKGRISVASNIVLWEEMHVVGCFEEVYYVYYSVMPPIVHYTLMA